MTAEPSLQRLKEAIDTNNFASVKELMQAHPELHRAPLEYAVLFPGSELPNERTIAFLRRKRA